MPAGSRATGCLRISLHGDNDCVPCKNLAIAWGITESNRQTEIGVVFKRQGRGFAQEKGRQVVGLVTRELLQECKVAFG
jgi:hypothetical protein